MTATFRIEQGATIGSWGRALATLEPASIGGDVTLRAQDVHLTYDWTVTSQPDGSTVVPVPGVALCTLTCEERGGYLVRLVVDAGLPGEDMLELYLGIPFEQSALAIPAWNETSQDNSETPHTGEKGWWPKLERFLKWADTNAGIYLATGVGNPNGILTARAGTHYYDTLNEITYMNVDGGTTWVLA